MKMIAKGVMTAVLLAAVAGCQDQKPVPPAAATVEQAAPTVEEPAPETPAKEHPAADTPKDHPAH
jgi:hypothetical protein